MPNHLLLPVMVDVIVTVIVFIMLSTPKAQKSPDKMLHRYRLWCLDVCCL